MFSVIRMSAQTTLGLNGVWGITDASFTSLNSYEYNPSNFSTIKDLGFSLTYGSELSDNLTSNLYQISVGKSFKNHFISVRYTPGYQKEFVFKSGEAVTYGNSNPIKLESRFQYKEFLGLGYSYRFSPNFSLGFNVRFFNQNFTQEILTPVFSDTIYFTTETEEDDANFWKADIGFVWKPFDEFYIQASSENLFIINNKTNLQNNDKFKLKTDRAFLLGATFNPFKDLNVNLIYESTNSFQTQLLKFIDVSNNKFGLGISTFHDHEQNPFFAGILSSAIFSSKSFDISLTWLNYFSNRNILSSYNDFAAKSISNIINNRFSFDKLLLTANFKLNTQAEQRVKFVDITINQSIYPALADKYIDDPIATARVVNLTDEKINIKPAVLINGINKEKIQSPDYFIMPFDTSDINFYTIIPESYYNSNPVISYANFYLITVNDEYDDELQKPILINGINAWDGNVHNLKYFIKKDLSFSANYSKEILALNKPALDTVLYSLVDFYKAKTIYNTLVKNLTYTSDPRATAEYVQYPKETIEVKGGDCDDLSVCFSSLLESIGIETALVDYKADPNLKHVNIMFNTKLSPEQANLITENDTKYFIRKNDKGIDEVWVPVETTSLTDFDTAWSIGSQKFQSEGIDKLGLIKGDVEIVDIN